MNYNETLCESMEIIAKGILEGISYDKTITCTIIDDSKKAQGEYMVSDGSVDFIAYTTDQSFRNGNVVYVTIPEGNYDNTKIIVSKKINKDEAEPFIYSAPWSNFLDVSGNVYKGNAVDGLTANDSAKRENLLYNDNNLIGYAGFTHFGIRADFKSWLSNLDCVSGDYGLKLELTFNSPQTDSQEEAHTYQYTAYLNTNDMIGNPYGFDSFYTQEKVFDISKLGILKGIKVYFYQNCDFYDKQGAKIPSQDEFQNILLSNLFVQDIYLSVGYELSSYDTDFIQLYTFDKTTYVNTAPDDSDKHILLKWVHVTEDGQHLDMSQYEEIEDFEIRWYRYHLGNPSPDEYAGVYWEKVYPLANTDNLKSFEYTLHPDIYKAEYEQIKAIAIYNGVFYVSNVLTFTNDKQVVNDATIDAIKALSLICVDVIGDGRLDSEGNYFIYDQGNNLIDLAEAQTTRRVECHLNLASSGAEDGLADLTDDDEVIWTIPKDHTMIVYEASEGITTDGDRYVISYKGKNQIDASKKNQVPCIDYKIRSYYSPMYQNNTITCTVKRNGITYYATKELSFGQAGTTGTDFTFVLDWDNNKTAFTVGKNETLGITARLYNTTNKEQDLTGKNIEWSWFKSPTTANISIVSSAGNTQYKVDLSATNNLTINEIYILQATMKDWGDYELTAYLPIPIRSSTDYSYITGATQIIYTTNAEPLYYRNEYKIYNSTGIEYNGEVSWDEYYGSIDDEVKVYLPDITKNKNDLYVIRPVSMYIKELPAVAAQCKISGSVVWTQPILIIQNRYPSAMVNKWDGKKTVVEDGHILANVIGAGKKNKDNSFSGVLLGDLVDKIDVNANITNTGIFGFHEGAMSYSLTDDGKMTIGKATSAQLIFDGTRSTIYSNGWNQDIKNGMELDFQANTIEAQHKGKTIFKLNGSSDANSFLTIADGSDDPKILMQVGSGNYYLKSSNYDVNTKKGMYINLQTGSLNIGGGNFTVDESGYLTATGANISGTITADKLYANEGTIAGWSIGNNGLYPYNNISNGINSTLSINSVDGTIYVGNNIITVKSGNDPNSTAGALLLKSDAAISLNSDVFWTGGNSNSIHMKGGTLTFKGTTADFSNVTNFKGIYATLA